MKKLYDAESVKYRVIVPDGAGNRGDGGREAFVAEKIRACQAALDRHFEKITHRLKGDA